MVSTRCTRSADEPAPARLQDRGDRAALDGPRRGDRVLTVLTPRLGKLRVIAKGVRRPRSGIGGGLSPSATCSSCWRSAARSTSSPRSSLEDPHLGLRNDLHSTAAAWYVVELADRFCGGRRLARGVPAPGPGAVRRSMRARRSPRGRRAGGSSSISSTRWASPRADALPGVRRAIEPEGTSSRPRRRRRLPVVRARGARRA